MPITTERAQRYIRSQLLLSMFRGVSARGDSLPWLGKHEDTTPLIAAAAHGRLAVVRLLLAWDTDGASPNIVLEDIVEDALCFLNVWSAKRV